MESLTILCSLPGKIFPKQIFRSGIRESAFPGLGEFSLKKENIKKLENHFLKITFGGTFIATSLPEPLDSQRTDVTDIMGKGYEFRENK